MGIPFSFFNLSSLVDLQIGIVQRQDDTRREAFCILYCDFSGQTETKIAESLEQVVRTSDAYVHEGNHYFFILYQTDIYGSGIVAKMLEEFFSTELKHHIVSFPKHGENTEELFGALQVQVKKQLSIELACLDKNTRLLSV